MYPQEFHLKFLIQYNKKTFYVLLWWQSFIKVHMVFTNILVIGNEFFQHFNSEISIHFKKAKEMACCFSVILQLRYTLALIKARIPENSFRSVSQAHHIRIWATMILSPIILTFPSSTLCHLWKQHTTVAMNFKKLRSH